ncbi:MAG: transposase [Gammaproteobacteria bacterium]|nr:transposase [Gammaproteobacteria bacterium]
MLTIPDGIEIYLYSEPIDMRKGINGLTILLVNGIVKSEVRQSHSIFLRMFFENIQPVTRHYGAPWGAY